MKNVFEYIQLLLEEYKTLRNEIIVKEKTKISRELAGT